MSNSYQQKFNLEALLKEIDEQYPQCFKYNFNKWNLVNIKILDNPDEEEVLNAKKALKEVELEEVYYIIKNGKPGDDQALWQLIIDKNFIDSPHVAHAVIKQYDNTNLEVGVKFDGLRKNKALLE